MKKAELCAALALLCVGAEAGALDFEYGGINFDLKTRASLGATMRMQDRNPGLIGKLNIEGQQGLCRPDNCVSLTGDPSANQRLVDAQGSFFGHLRDDGNLNYDKHDIVAALGKLDADLKVTWGDWFLRVRGLGYYDPINTDFDNRHTNTYFQPATTPRDTDVERYFAMGAQLRDAFVQYSFQVGDRAGAVSVGQQTVRWGESGLLAINSVSEINPPNAVLLHTPGTEIGELFQPVPLALFAIDLFRNVTAEVVYQFGWVPVKVDARGSYFSDLDTFGDRDGDDLPISQGQFEEDPDGLPQFSGLLGLISDKSVVGRILPSADGYPSDGGQYGARLSYFADWFNDGTEVSLYFFNYHSRYPYLSMYAAQDSCSRDSTPLTALLDCGLQAPIGQPLFSEEALTIHTVRALVDYPEDIQMYGISFNTTIGGWSLAGEYSFRPNVPLQVGLTDVAFAALQPTFPRHDLPIGTSAVPGLGPLLQQLGLDVDVITLPGARAAVPDYLSVYRGRDNNDPNNDINGGEFIPGYERMNVGQLDLTLLQAFSNVLWADQIILIGEAGFTQVFDMPPLSQLQFEGGSYRNTHHSPGADGTGQPNGQPDTRSFNPTQQNEGFADDFAWGLRSLIRGEYNDVVFGWTFMPTIIAMWDVKGIAPYPLQNFVEGRKDLVVGTEVKITPDFTATVLYQWFLGGGLDNTRLDRDNLSMSVSYTF
jgi:hypothetical protein